MQLADYDLSECDQDNSFDCQMIWNILGIYRVVSSVVVVPTLNLNI